MVVTPSYVRSVACGGDYVWLLCLPCTEDNFAVVQQFSLCEIIISKIIPKIAHKIMLF